MTNIEFAALLAQAIEQCMDRAGYIDPSNIADVCLDGRFNFYQLASRLLARQEDDEYDAFEKREIAHMEEIDRH